MLCPRLVAPLGRLEAKRWALALDLRALPVAGHHSRPRPANPSAWSMIASGSKRFPVVSLTQHGKSSARGSRARRGGPRRGSGRFGACADASPGWLAARLVTGASRSPQGVWIDACCWLRTRIYYGGLQDSDSRDPLRNRRCQRRRWPHVHTSGSSWPS